MQSFIVKLTDLEVKALKYDIVDVQVWINNAVYNKVRRNINRIVTRYTDKQPNKISDKEKVDILADVDFDVVNDRQIKMAD